MQSNAKNYNQLPMSSYPAQTTDHTRAKSQSPTSLGIAVCCLAIIAALVLGVGLTSNLVLRHLVQTLPLWVAVTLGFRASRATSWVSLPLFLFWLVLMGIIWAYLLGISHLVSGTFSSIEIAMTILVGAACLIGIVSCFRFTPLLSPLRKGSFFALMAVVQLLCFRFSFLAAIARR